MAYDQKSLDDYVDVAERITEFRTRHPEGTLQSADLAEPYRLLQAQGVDKNGEVVQQTFIVYVAAAYRAPDDDRPGIGVAWEVFPGRTNFTRGSELQNAETSAWGRAIIAVGAADAKRGVASRQEVRNRRAEREDGLPVNADGSLSRSRTSDEEKSAAGVMTDQQQRAHNQLGREVQGKGPQGTQRTRATPGDDPFYDQPPPEERAGSIAARQKSSMFAMFAALKVRERGAQLDWIERVIGRRPEHRDGLSFVEAGQVLEALRAATTPDSASAAG